MKNKFVCEKDTNERINEKYVLINDLSIQQLAVNPILFKRVCEDWALYPDHIVFLGPLGNTYQSIKDESLNDLLFSSFSPTIFILVFSSKLNTLKCDSYFSFSYEGNSHDFSAFSINCNSKCFVYIKIIIIQIF